MRILISIMALIAGVLPVAAADVFPSTKDSRAYVAPAEIASAQSWSSIWVAALAGYSMTNTEIGLDGMFSDGEGGVERHNLGTLDGLGGEGWDATLQLGADLEIRGLVAGVIAEYSFGGTQSEFSAFDGAFKANIDQKDSYCLLGRLGVARGDTLFYGASGWCHTEFELTTSGLESNIKGSKEFDGVPLEVGVEHRFSPNIRGRLAGRYTYYGKEETRFTNEDGDELGRVTHKPGQWSVKAGIVISTGIGQGLLERN